MNTKELIQLARHHVLAGNAVMLSSAELCLSDAISAYDRARDTLNDKEVDRLYQTARERALKSLAYTIGVGHEDYKRAKEAYTSVT